MINDCIVTTLKDREQMYAAPLQKIIGRYFPAGASIPPGVLGMLDEINSMFRLSEPGRRVDEEEVYLNEEKDFIKQVVDSTPTLIFVKDRDGNFVFVNKTLADIFGKPPEEIVARRNAVTRHRPEEVAEYSAIDRQVIDTLQPIIIEEPFTKPDGEELWYLTSKKPFIRRNGEVQVLAISTEITLQRRAEHLLRQTTSRLTAIIQNLQAAILQEDEARRLVVVNQEFCTLFRIPVPPEALIGADCAVAAETSKSLFIDPDTFISRIEEILAKRVLVTGEELHLVDGRILERDYVPIFAGTAYMGHMWQYHNVTERKTAEHDIRGLNQELLSANKLLTIERDRQTEHVKMLEDLTRMKSDFVSSVSHELRTPLASIIGFTETILIDPEMPRETEQEFLGIILNESQRLAKLINDLLDLSRIESGRVEIEKREADIVPVVSHAISLVVTEAENKSIALTSTCECPELIARFDEERMMQIILNLLSNAVKFTQEGGAITIFSSVVDGCLEISVNDNGMGIPASDIPFIFTKFYRVHRPRLQIRGTGLGLAIVKHLVELHGGTVHVKSEEAKGSIFTVRIPT